MAFYGLFGILQIAVGLLLEKPLFNLFHVSGAAQAYFLILLSCALSNVAAMFLSVFKGIQRMDKSNSLEVKISIVNAIGTIVFLEFGWGMLGLAMNALGNACFAMLLTWWTLRRTMPRISVGWHFDGKLLRSMFAYGIKMQVSQVGGLICFRDRQADRVALSRDRFGFLLRVEFANDVVHARLAARDAFSSDSRNVGARRKERSGQDPAHLHAGFQVCVDAHGRLSRPS